MDLRAEILRDYSKPHVMELARQIGSDQRLFKELIELFLGEEWRITQRASWVVMHCHDQDPSLIQPHLGDLIHNLDNEVHVAVKRNTVRVLQDVDVPEDMMGPLADRCFQYISDPKEPVAVKVFSMTILANCAIKFPELKEEVKMVINDWMPYGSAGFLSRAKKVLKTLEKL